MPWRSSQSTQQKGLRSRWVISMRQNVRKLVQIKQIRICTFKIRRIDIYTLQQTRCFVYKLFYNKLYTRDGETASTCQKPAPNLKYLPIDPIRRDLQCPPPYTWLYADDIFLCPHNKGDLQRLFQRWSNRFMQHLLRLIWNKTASLTTYSNEIRSIAAIGNRLLKTK